MIINRNAVGAALLGLTLLAGASRAGVLAPEPYAWQTIPFGGAGYVDGFLYHPQEQNLLYARTDVGGLYRFDFVAKRWIPLLDHLGKPDADLMGVLSMAIDPHDPAKIYAASGLYLPDWARKGAILRSADRGKTWEKAELPIHVGGNADGRGSGDRLVVDPQNGALLWYGSNADGLWKSTDGGKSFAKDSSPATSLSLVAITPQSHELFVGSADGKGALLVSVDGGKHFNTVAGTPDLVPQHIAFGADGAVYVTFAQGDDKQPANPSFALRGAVWKRDSAGKWREISPLRPDNNATFGYSGVDVGPDGSLAVSTIDRWAQGDDIFLSHDGGAHWDGLGKRSHHDATAYPWLMDYTRGEDRMGHWISDLKINPFNRDELVYGTGYGLWMSRNLSAASVTFDFAVANLEEAATIQLASPPSGPVLLAAFGDVAGAAYSDLSKTPRGLFSPMHETNYSIDYAGLKPSVLARVTNNDATHGFISDDAGATWAAFGSTPYQSQEGKREWHSPGAVAVSAGGKSLVWVPEKDAAYFSLDHGKTWKPSAGWPSQREQALVPVADKAVEGVFYVFDRPSGSILISVDAGISFTKVVNGLPPVQGWETAQFAVVPGRMRDLWIAAPYGLVHSPDSATAVTNMKDVTSAWAIGFGAPKVKGAYPAVYLWGKVKGQDGLWRSDDEGANWSRINDDAHQFGGFSAVTGDMREFGTLYTAPRGHGLLLGKPGK